MDAILSTSSSKDEESNDTLLVDIRSLSLLLSHITKIQHFHSCYYHIDNEKVELNSIQIRILLVESYKMMPGSKFVLIISPEGKILKREGACKHFSQFHPHQ